VPQLNCDRLMGDRLMGVFHGRRHTWMSMMKTMIENDPRGTSRCSMSKFGGVSHICSLTMELQSQFSTSIDHFVLSVVFAVVARLVDDANS
jgi:hypothetical protein